MPKPNIPKPYWKNYDSLYKNNSKKSIFKKLKRLCRRKGEPYSKKDNRGRKPKFSPVEYTSFICLQKIFRHRYREMELEAELYLPDKADHSTFARNYAKIPEEYIEWIIMALVDKEFNYWIADSTAISTKMAEVRTRQGLRNKQLLTDKYHLLIGYDPPASMTYILGAKATDNHVSDSQGVIMLLKDKTSNAYFFGDSAYNTYELHDTIKKVGLFPMIKPDIRRIRKSFSSKAANIKLFSGNFYKNVRGIVETVFGGATNAGLMLTYAKKVHTRRLDTLMLALRHNLMTSMRLFMFLCDKLPISAKFKYTNPYLI